MLLSLFIVFLVIIIYSGLHHIFRSTLLIKCTNMKYLVLDTLLHTQQKFRVCMTRLNHFLLFACCPTILNKIVELESGITMLNDIVDNNEH